MSTEERDRLIRLAHRGSLASQALYELRNQSKQAGDNILFRFDQDWKIQTAIVLATLHMLGEEFQAFLIEAQLVSELHWLGELLESIGNDLLAVSESFTEAVEVIDSGPMVQARERMRLATSKLGELKSELAVIRLN